MTFSTSAICVALLFASGSLRAQSGVVILPEARLDVIAARSLTSQAGLALSAGGPGYNRVVLAAGAGTAWKDGHALSSFRVDGTMRFLLDPYRTSRWGLYGLGGLGALYDGFNDWRALVLIGLGVEFPSRKSAEWATELGFGGGLRLGVVLRRVHPDHR